MFLSPTVAHAPATNSGEPTNIRTPPWPGTAVSGQSKWKRSEARVQIKDIDRNEIIQLLRDWGHEPVLVSVLPRVCLTGLIAACLYEIDLQGCG